MAYPSVTYTFTNGTTADGANVSTNFTNLVSGLSDGTKDLNMNAATFAGNLTANGNIVLGNATSDTIALTGIVSIGTSGSYLANLGGTVLLPTYTFTGDLNTGIWSSGADAIDISTAGVQRVRVDSAGVVQIGSSATPPAASIRLGQLFTIHTSANYGGPSINTWSTTAAEGPLIDFNRSKSATIGTMTVVQSADLLGMVSFRGADGTNFINAATIAAYVDGTPGTNDMPGRLVFSTTADGASSVTERMRITSGGYVGIGATTPLSNLHVAMETNVNPRNITNQFSAAATGGARFDSLKSRGSISSPTAIVNGDVIGTFAFKPHDGSSFLETAYIAGISNGTVAVGSVPTDLSFATGSASGTVRMRVYSDGTINLGTRIAQYGQASVIGSYIAATSAANSIGGLYVGSNDAVAADKGGVISLGSVYTTNTDTRYAAIAGLKENATDGQYGGYMAFYTRANGAAPAEQMRISSAGVVTMTNLAGAGSRAVNADASGNLSATSDSRLKQEVSDSKLPGLNEVLQLQPRSYKWLKDIEQRGENAAIEVGFFADQVAPIIPSAAPLCADGMYGLYDRSIVAALVNAVKELTARIEVLEKK